MADAEVKRTRQSLFAEAVRALDDAFHEGFHAARVELVAGKAEALPAARTDFRVLVPRLHLLQGRWQTHQARFKQIGRAAALIAGLDSSATLTADSGNGDELIGPSELVWVVSFGSGASPYIR